MATNNFLPFCPTDTGTNLLSQSDYAADADRTSGNKPGKARSKLDNKAIRQPAFIVSQLAQYISDKMAVNLLDDADTIKLLAQMNSAFLPLPPILKTYTSGSGTHNLSYVFFIASGNATVNATYTNNSITYTVSSTISSGIQLIATGSGAPEAFGTLTKASGTGDSTITFYAVRAPILMSVRGVGAGGGGAGSGTTTSGGTGGNGGNTTFGALTGNGGLGAVAAATQKIGGTATGGDINIQGQDAGWFSLAAPYSGGSGGNSGIGSGGIGSNLGEGNVGHGYGSGGGGGWGTVSSVNASPGGSGGGYFEKLYINPSGTYSYAVGAGGTAGTAGTSGFVGGAGASGIIILQMIF